MSREYKNLDHYDERLEPSRFRRPGQLVPMTDEEYWTQYATNALCGLVSADSRVFDVAMAVQEEAKAMGESIAWFDAKAVARRTILWGDTGDRTLPGIVPDPPPPDEGDRFVKRFPPPRDKAEAEAARRMSVAASKALAKWGGR